MDSAPGSPQPTHLLPDGTPVLALVDGGSMDCGSGLLLLITREVFRCA